MSRITPSSYIADLKDIIFDILEKEHIESFFVRFDGSGDSGQIEEIDLSDTLLKKKIEGVKIPNGWRYEKGVRTQTFKDANDLEDVISGVVYNILEQTCDGWEINEGSYGEFAFDVENRKVKLDFNERVMSVKSSTYEF